MGMIKDIETYFIDGCGRCSLFASEQCKAVRWRKELTFLRKIISELGLEETVKWGVPCYMYQGKNLFMLSAFKHYCGIMFFQGALLKDENKLLARPSEQTQATRQLRYTESKDIIAQKETIKSYILESIEIEKSGVKAIKSAPELPIPEELQAAFHLDKGFEHAFEALTPGRRRGYLLFFNSAKQSATRTNRIEKYKATILLGKGMND
jgi:uncharacterized protein YdeI (YjbR/CyaY-like superfamily)